MKFAASSKAEVCAHAELSDIKNQLLSIFLFSGYFSLISHLLHNICKVCQNAVINVAQADLSV